MTGPSSTWHEKNIYSVINILASYRVILYTIPSKIGFSLVLWCIRLLAICQFEMHGYVSCVEMHWYKYGYYLPTAVVVMTKTIQEKYQHMQQLLLENLSMYIFTILF